MPKALYILPPSDVPTQWLPYLLDLIASGSQVERHFVQIGLTRAMFVGFIMENNEIVSTITLKHPLKTYREKVFKKAGVANLHSNYTLELGYIVTRKGFEGRKLCQHLLREFMTPRKTLNLFATTRKESMIHILQKFGFTPIGKTYDTDLKILVYTWNNQINATVA